MGRSRSVNLMNVCPICRVYDPSWFVHFKDCPMDHWRPFKHVGLVLAIYRRDDVRIRGGKHDAA